MYVRIVFSPDLGLLPFLRDVFVFFELIYGRGPKGSRAQIGGQVLPTLMWTNVFSSTPLIVIIDCISRCCLSSACLFSQVPCVPSNGTYRIAMMAFLHFEALAQDRKRSASELYVIFQLKAARLLFYPYRWLARSPPLATWPPILSYLLVVAFCTTYTSRCNPE